MDPRLRAADTDREHVADLLQRHTAAGRLSLDEYEQRVAGAWQATTLAELAALTADLPADQPNRRAGHRLPVAAIAAGLALVSLVSLVVLAGLLALTGTPGWAHMGSMMATMGTMSGCH